MPRNKIKQKSFLETLIDDTNIFEKIVLLLWSCMPYLMFLISKDIINIWYRIGVSIGSFVLLTLLVYIFAVYMADKDKDWN